MNEYTQRVVTLAPTLRGDSAWIQNLAASGLSDYLLEKSGRPVSSVSEKAWSVGAKTVYAAVRKAWAAEPNSREHIRQVAALGQLLGDYDGRLGQAGTSKFILTVGNDLHLWENWPELHNVYFPQSSWWWRLTNQEQINPNQITSNPFWDSWKITKLH